MITVADIIALPAFKSIELAAPCEGAEAREVRNVGILDCPPDYNEYGTYFPGEFIVTNLGFAYDDSLLAEKSLRAMLRRGVAGIAVKRVYQAPVSESVRRESTARGVPLYIYDGGYHEMVAYQSLDLIRRDQDEQDKAQAIDELLETYDGDAVRKKLSGIAGITGSTLQCFALALRAGDTCSFYAMLDAVSSALSPARGIHQAIESLQVCCYRSRILVFVSYGAANNDEVAVAGQRCVARMCTAGDLHCGMSEAVSLSDGDLGIRQALAAADAARRRGLRTMRFSQLHVSAFAEAAREDRLFMSVSESYRSLLRDYDSAHGTELVQTAERLVRAYGDIKTVSEQMHQHPNTIRYRMRKAKAILGVSDEPDKSFVNLLGLMFLPDF